MVQQEVGQGEVVLEVHQVGEEVLRMVLVGLLEQLVLVGQQEQPELVGQELAWVQQGQLVLQELVEMVEEGMVLILLT